MVRKNLHYPSSLEVHSKKNMKRLNISHRHRTSKGGYLYYLSQLWLTDVWSFLLTGSLGWTCLWKTSPRSSDILICSLASPRLLMTFVSNALTRHWRGCYSAKGLVLASFWFLQTWNKKLFGMFWLLLGDGAILHVAIVLTSLCVFSS